MSSILEDGRSLLGAALICLLLLGVGAPSPIEAQAVDSLRVEVARLLSLVDSLRAEVARLQDGGRQQEAADALTRLREAAAAAAAAGGGASPATAPEEQEFVGRQRSLQSLNPEISVNADVLGHLNKDDVEEDNFVAREVEISLISNLDPFSRAKIFLARHVPGGEIAPFPEAPGEHHEEGGGFAIEEGYVEWVGLPSGIGLKFGRFFQQFGQLNRWHSHALPFQSRSLPHLAFLGEEAFGQTGASVHWLAPVGGDAGTYELTVEVTKSSSEHLFGESGRVSVLSHVNGFWNLSNAIDLDLGVSWINGSYEDVSNLVDRNLFGAEMALSWRPPDRSRYRGVTVRGGVMILDGLVPPPGVTAADDRAFGFWSMTEVRLDERWLIGARFDRTESSEDPSETAWLLSPTLTWWQSEFVRLRAEYDLIGRSFVSGTEGRFLLQVTFAMGPHKHETY